MAILNLQDLKPGMVLAADAKHHSGRVLLAAGTELTEKHLKVFHTWGLTEADIDGVDPQQVAAEEYQEIDPAILQLAEQQNRERFRHTDLQHPAMAELFRLSIRNTARQLVSKTNELDG